MQSNRKINKWDFFFGLSLITAVTLILLPWQFVPYSNVEKSIYKILQHSVWMSAMVYLFFRARVFPILSMLVIQGGVILCIFLGGVNLYWYAVFWGLPAEYNSYMLYEEINNPNHKVLYIYYKGYLPTQGHWEFKEVMDVSDWDFRLEKQFDKSDLNGVWKMYDLHNDFEYSKTALLIDGEVEKVLSTSDNK